MAAAEKINADERDRSHTLDSKSLIRSALEKGLVCSVVNPNNDENDVAQYVANASKRADIICLDWQMNDNDDGVLATKIIEEILKIDEEIGGRLRLIAIYTGEPRRDDILGLIANRINEDREEQDELVARDDVLVNSSGLRLAWRQKSLGNTNLPHAISEEQLPGELLTEFAQLSEGLLSNVALATISAMRDTTHHVLSKFTSELDGPFLHHRALLDKKTDSMDYAVSIIMSALKSEVDKSQITSKFTTKDAVRHRVEFMASAGDAFTLRYPQGGGEKEFHLSSEDVLEIVEEGPIQWTQNSAEEAMQRLENQQNAKPSKKIFKYHFSSVFSSDLAASQNSKMHFSFLTNSTSSELSKIHLKMAPKLDLGSVIHSEETGYLLCLQATCDTVRGAGLFFFIPLEVLETDQPDIVVPHCDNAKKPQYVGLSIPTKCYTKSRSLDFGAIDDDIGHITIVYDRYRKKYYVTDALNQEYRWLANLKYKRALRIAQSVSCEISRVGFDEFEPFKK